jgi:hypothetical protein
VEVAVGGDVEISLGQSTAIAQVKTLYKSNDEELGEHVRAIICWYYAHKELPRKFRVQVEDGKDPRELFKPPSDLFSGCEDDINLETVVRSLKVARIGKHEVPPEDNYYVRADVVFQKETAKPKTLSNKGKENQDKENEKDKENVKDKEHDKSEEQTTIATSATTSSTTSSTVSNVVKRGQNKVLKPILRDILVADPFKLPENPVVQIIKIKKIPCDGHSRYRLIISDGLYSYMFCTLGTNCNHLVEKALLQENCIVEIVRYTSNIILKLRKMIIILELKVLNMGAVDVDANTQPLLEIPNLLSEIEKFFKETGPQVCKEIISTGNAKEQGRLAQQTVHTIDLTDDKGMENGKKRNRRSVSKSNGVPTSVTCSVLKTSPLVMLSSENLPIRMTKQNSTIGVHDGGSVKVKKKCREFC